jgi:hypothetical protein
MIDDNILRFNVSMHDAYGVSVMESFENLIDVVLAVRGCNLRNEAFVLSGLHVLEN